MTTMKSMTALSLANILEEISESMFDEKLVKAQEQPKVVELTVDAGMLGRSLKMSGSPAIELVLLCSKQCGLQIAGRMIACDDSVLDEEMIHDALGELLNVVAGQIKSALGSSHALGLPSGLKSGMLEGDRLAADWEGYVMTTPGQSARIWIGLRCHT